MFVFPENLSSLRLEEEEIKRQSLAQIDADGDLVKYFRVTEAAMNAADVFRQVEADDQDLLALQLLSARLFNAFASAIKLMLGGYYQNAGLVLRDALETIFLLDLFRHDPTAISRWRVAKTVKERREFQPAKVREVLDQRDGFTERKRDKLYKLFSELAAHPNRKADSMLRPIGADAKLGPFFDPTALSAVAAEMGRLAVQAGGLMASHSPDGFQYCIEAKEVFDREAAIWMGEFYRLKD